MHWSGFGGDCADWEIKEARQSLADTSLSFEANQALFLLWEQNMKTVFWLSLVSAVSADQLIELDSTLEPVPLANVLEEEWLTCEQPGNVSTTTEPPEHDDDLLYDYGGPDGTFKHPSLRRTDRVQWQLMSRALEWEVNQNKGQRYRVAGKLPAGVGSENSEFFYQAYDKGFFNTILSAYAHHWGLRTSPDDWWYTVVRRAALAIDNNANKDSVRDFFVSHEGKKELRVELGSSLYTADYTWFFQQMTNQVFPCSYTDYIFLFQHYQKGGCEYQEQRVCANHEVRFRNFHP